MVYKTFEDLSAGTYSEGRPDDISGVCSLPYTQNKIMVNIQICG